MNDSNSYYRYFYYCVRSTPLLMKIK